jgi:transcription elongation factor GreA-like protein
MMRQWRGDFSRHVTIARWVVLLVLVVLFVQSLLFPMELIHTYHLSIGSALACLVILSRDSDIFVARAWIPYPVLIGLVLLAPIMAWRRS